MSLFNGRPRNLYSKDGKKRVIGTEYVDRQGHVTGVLVNLDEVDFSIPKKSVERLQALERNNGLRGIPPLALMPRRIR